MPTGYPQNPNVNDMRSKTPAQDSTVTPGEVTKPMTPASVLSTLVESVVEKTAERFGMNAADKEMASTANAVVKTKTVSKMFPLALVGRIKEYQPNVISISENSFEVESNPSAIIVATGSYVENGAPHPKEIIKIPGSDVVETTVHLISSSETLLTTFHIDSSAKDQALRICDSPLSGLFEDHIDLSAFNAFQRFTTFKTPLVTNLWLAGYGRAPVGYEPTLGEFLALAAGYEPQSKTWEIFCQTLEDYVVKGFSGSGYPMVESSALAGQISAGAVPYVEHALVQLKVLEKIPSGEFTRNFPVNYNQYRLTLRGRTMRIKFTTGF